MINSEAFASRHNTTQSDNSAVIIGNFRSASRASESAPDTLRQKNGDCCGDRCDPELESLVGASSLPDHIKRAVMALVNTAKA